MKLKQKLKTARKRAGLSQAALASRCGWIDGQSRISHYETGRSIPSVDELKIIARSVGVPVESLISESSMALSPIELGSISVVSCIPHLNINKRLTELSVPKNIPANCYAVEIPDNSLEPEFSRGDYLVVNPSLDPQPGHYVVAHDEKMQVAFGQLSINAHGAIVTPTNTRYPLFPIPNGGAVAGVIVYKMKSYI